MRTFILIASLMSPLLFSTSCDLLRMVKEKVPSILKVTVVDENDVPYGYVTVTLVNEQGRVIASVSANERGGALFREGLVAGTYSFVVKNATGTELKVLEPQTVKVALGRTVEVTVKVERVVAETDYD